MTTIQQALHIFRKDARHLRFELVASGLLLMILMFTSVDSWEEIQQGGRRIMGNTPGPPDDVDPVVLDDVDRPCDPDGGAAG